MPTTISGHFMTRVEGNGRVFTPLLPTPVYVHDAVQYGIMHGDEVNVEIRQYPTSVYTGS
jgi:hypothetical protein